MFQNIDMRGGDTSQCWEWQGEYNERARNCYWSLNGKKVIPYRLVYELVHGVELATHQHILHSCDNRRCCNVNHMSLGTNRQNVDDRNARERQGMPHFVIRAIRKLIVAHSWSDSAIAELFGKSVSTINKIRNGTAYGYVTETSGDTSTEPGVNERTLDDEGERTA